jgi:uncharacterized membrane-anchored protein YhcB (DUF1043 family)
MVRKAVKYDSALIYEFAARLYAQAGRVVFLYALMGLLVGTVAGGLVAQTTISGLDTRGQRQSTLLTGMIIGGVAGVLLARERAFQLRLKAQLALCDVAIEENTRRA